MVKVGNCPDSWGVWFDKDDKQMSWLRFTEECSRAGFKYIEIGPLGYMSTDPSVLNEEFKKRGLVPVAGNIMFDLEDDSLMEASINKTKTVCELSKKIGAEYFIIMDGMYSDMWTGELLKPKALDEDAWKRLVKNLVAISRVAQDCGIKPVFHPHAATHVEYEPQIERLLAETSPKDVMLCFDTGHHIYCEGNDVYSFMENYADRISFLHLKDLVKPIKEEVWKKDISFSQATKMGVWAEIGKGEIDFVRIKKILDKNGFNGYAIIEHDMYPVDFDVPFEIQKRTGEYLTSIGFGTLE
ncbi:MAG: sugar phosphate isomerase/epimerase family protein [Christensenellales bacterium]|jgi:inosose dehydratase